MSEIESIVIYHKIGKDPWKYFRSAIYTNIIFHVVSRIVVGLRASERGPSLFEV